MNWIPKIIYTPILGGSEITITFSAPPEGDPYKEEYKGIRKTTRSSSGSAQTQYNYTLKMYDLTFLFEPEATKLAFDSFVKFHCFRGGVFKYYPSSDETDYALFEFSGNSYKPSRPIPDGAGDFEYNLKFKIERVDDTEYELEETGVNHINETQFTIVNDTTVADDVLGLSFDGSAVRGAFIEYTLYRNHTAPASEVSESGAMLATYKTVDDSWEIIRSSVGDAGVTFTITSDGQVQYTSTDISGSVATSVMKFKASTIGVEE